MVDLLLKNHAILEITVTDVGAHREDGIIRYRNELANHMEGNMFRTETSKRAAALASVMRH